MKHSIDGAMTMVVLGLAGAVFGAIVAGVLAQLALDLGVAQ